MAAYSATKAYEKSLAQSMGRELEKYGVGVTCIMPGAVKGTDFATRSKAQEALCWKLPFYPMKAPNVASRGVRALLTGDSEVIPGWHNRLFLKIFTPLLPQRLVTSVVGFSFTPLRIGAPTLPWMTVSSESDEVLPLLDSISTKKPPMVLKLGGSGKRKEVKVLMDSIQIDKDLNSNSESNAGVEQQKHNEEHSQHMDASDMAEHVDDKKE